MTTDCENVDLFALEKLIVLRAAAALEEIAQMVDEAQKFNARSAGQHKRRFLEGVEA